MKIKRTGRFLVALILVLSSCPDILADHHMPPYNSAVAADKFSDSDLDQMLVSIALYPDPLLAQMLPAATFPDQLDAAQRALKGYVDEKLIESQTWEMSVKAIAHYPSILAMMCEKQDWTVALGEAYVNQPADVELSIQRLRVHAMNAGALQSNNMQEVKLEDHAITVVPSEAEVFYIPEYMPQVMYVDSTPYWAWGTVTFGTALAIGAWLNNSWRWYGGGIYYHGWTGSGWIARSRPVVNPLHSPYVNDRFKNINSNRNVNNRSVTAYRNTLNARNVTHPNTSAASTAGLNKATNLNPANPNKGIDSIDRPPAGDGADNLGRVNTGGNAYNANRGDLKTGTLNRDWLYNKPSAPLDLGGVLGAKQNDLADFRGRGQDPHGSLSQQPPFGGVTSRDMARIESYRGSESLGSGYSMKRGVGAARPAGGRRRR